MNIRLHPVRAIGVLAAVAVALVATGVGFLLWQARAGELDHERAQTAAFATAVARDAEQAFDAVDATLLGIQERMLTPYGKGLALDGDEVRLLLKARAFGLRPAAELVVFDAQGRVANASSDRDVVPGSAVLNALMAFAQAGRDGLLVLPPPDSDGPDRIVHFARILRSADGSQGGLAVALVRSSDLEQRLAARNAATARSVTVFGKGGQVIATVRGEAGAAAVAPRPADAEFALPPQPVRLVKGTASSDAAEAFAFGGSSRFPLWVSVPVRGMAAVAAWREDARAVVLGAAQLCATLLTAAWLLARLVVRQAKLAAALHDANDRYQKTIESVMDAIIAVDGNQAVCLFNPAAERMFGLSKAQVLGGPLARLIPARARASHMLHLDRFACAPRDSRAMGLDREITGLRADGTEFPIEATISRTLIDGQPQLTAVLRDVTKRRHADDEMRELNRQLRSLSASLQDVREQERARIALELHDELGQQLTGLKLELSWLTARLKEGKTPEPGEIAAMRNLVDVSIASVRRIATELRPPILDDLGFGEAVAWHAAEFARRSGIACRLDLQAQSLVTDDVVATALFRIVQESLTNVARHAGASCVDVKLVRAGADLVLSVRDDGTGMAPAGRGAKGIGLVSIRERAMSLGGRLDTRGEPGAGTTITVTLPLARPIVQRSNA